VIGVAIAIRLLGSIRLFLGRLDWRDPLVGVPVGIATQLLGVPAVYLVVEAIAGPQDVDGAAQDLFDRASGDVAIAALVLVVAVGAPLFEELLYRGVLQPALVTRFGPGVGVLGTALIFAAIHFQLVQFPGLVLIGLVLGGLAAWTGRLGPAIWAHVGFNATTALVLVTQS